MSGGGQTWWDRWGQSVTLGGVVTLLMGLAIVGYRSWPVIQAPQKAAQAARQADRALERAESAVDMVEQMARSVRLVWCVEGEELTERERRILRCSQLASTTPRAPSDARRASTVRSGTIVPPLMAAGRDTIERSTVRESMRTLVALSSDSTDG